MQPLSLMFFPMDEHCMGAWVWKEPCAQSTSKGAAACSLEDGPALMQLLQWVTARKQWHNQLLCHCQFVFNDTLALD